MAELGDYELLKKFRKGDSAAFEELVNRHRQLMFNFIYRMVSSQEAADDLFQETWLKVLRNADAYEPKAKFTTWALQIARNTVLDHFKRENLRQHASLDATVGDDEATFASVVPGDGPMPDEHLQSAEVREEVQKGIARLPARQREALVLRMYHELPYEDIAKLMGTPEGTAKYWVHEAVQALSEHLEKCGLK